ncbi:MAG: MraY family glycosyltransferase [Candidatus Andersenbacteria bacterium]
MIALDTSIIQPWHLYALLGVFVITYFLIGSLGREQKAGKIPAIGTVLAVVVAVAAFWVVDDPRLQYGLGLAAIIAIIAGKADEVGKLTVGGQLFWQLLIAAVLVLAGWTIPYITNPFDAGIIDLSWQQVGAVLIPGSILAFIWIVFFVNAINWIDGVDGLAASVLSIAFITLIVVSLLPQTQDSTTLALAVIGLGAIAAFFIWNYPPAKVYLGTTGAWFMGMYAALVAMHGGGKIVTTALVLALPAIDALFVISKRLLSGQRPWQGDRVSHIHHRLLAFGFSPRSIILMATIFSVILAAAGIAAATSTKIILLIVISIGFFLASLHVILKGRFSS